jgi:hypothetical protein
MTPPNPMNLYWLEASMAPSPMVWYVHGPNPTRFMCFGDVHRPTSYEFLRCGSVHGPKPYILDGPKPYKFICFGDVRGPKSYDLIRFGTTSARGSTCRTTIQGSALIFLQPHQPRPLKRAPQIVWVFMFVFAPEASGKSPIGPPWAFPGIPVAPGPNTNQIKTPRNLP